MTTIIDEQSQRHDVGTENHDEESNDDDEGQRNDDEDRTSIEKQLERAASLFHEDKILAAFRIFDKIVVKDTFSEKQQEMWEISTRCHDAVSDIIAGSEMVDATNSNSFDDTTTDTHIPWKRQGASHSDKFDTVVYYKLEEESKLYCRVETPIDQSLLLPLMAVCGESDLYDTWTPRWTMPRVGIRSSKQVRRVGKLNQTIHVVTDVPWPLYPREVVFKTTVIDDIDASGCFAVTLSTSDIDGLEEIVADDGKIELMDFDGTILFRPCPYDHPDFGDKSSSANKTTSTEGTTESSTNPATDSRKILVTFKM